MEIFRFTRNAWGQEVLEGVSWDLLWVFFLAGIAIVIGHALFMWLAARKGNTK
jgi:hypothetical protein